MADGAWRGRFRNLWLGTAASNLGDGVTLAAAPLLAATLTRDPVLVSGLVIAQRLPWFLFTLISGVLVDRLPRRSLLVAANVLRACAIATLAAVLALAGSDLTVLYACMFTLGVAETVVDTAALAVLPGLVPRHALEKANGRIFATESLVNQLLAPPIGSALFAIGAVTAFAAGGMGFASAAALLAFLPPSPPTTDPDPGSLKESIREGFSWFWNTTLIRTAAAMAGVVNLFGASTLGILVLFAQERLGLDAIGYGLLLSGAALGGVLGGVGAETIVRTLGSGPAIFLSNLLPAVGYLGLAFTSSPVVATLMLALGSFAAMVGNVVVITLRQAAVPDRLLGRVTSAYRLIALGALPLGGLVGGLLARYFGLTAPFLAGAAALGVLALALAPVLTTSAIDHATAQPDLQP